jgi:hypothetical protein
MRRKQFLPKKFRGSLRPMKPLTPRPDLYRRPAADEWFRKTGRTPFPLLMDLDAHTLAVAAELCRRDSVTLDGEAAFGIQDQLHMLCEVARMLAAEPEESTCFFDDTEGRFWIYPAAASPHHIP